MPNKIQVRRGAIADLPTLSAGEPGLALDSRQLFFGTNTTNLEIATTTQFADYFEATRNTGQSIAHATATAVAFNTVSVANDLFELQGDGSVKVLEEGTYEVSVCVQFAINSTGSRAISLFRNSGGSNFARSRSRVPATIDSTTPEVNAATTFACSADDLITVYAYQGSGGALDVIGNNALGIRVRRVG